MTTAMSQTSAHEHGTYLYVPINDRISSDKPALHLPKKIASRIHARHVRLAGSEPIKRRVATASDRRAMQIAARNYKIEARFNRFRDNLRHKADREAAERVYAMNRWNERLSTAARNNSSTFRRFRAVVQSKCEAGRLEAARLRMADDMQSRMQQQQARMEAAEANRAAVIEKRIETAIRLATKPSTTNVADSASAHIHDSVSHATLEDEPVLVPSPTKRRASMMPQLRDEVVVGFHGMDGYQDYQKLSTMDAQEEADVLVDAVIADAVEAIDEVLRGVLDKAQAVLTKNATTETTPTSPTPTTPVVDKD